MNAKGTPKPKPSKSSAGEKTPAVAAISAPVGTLHTEQFFKIYIFNRGFILVLTLAQGA